MTNILAKSDHTFVAFEDRIKAVIEQVKRLNHRRIASVDRFDFLHLQQRSIGFTPELVAETGFVFSLLVLHPHHQRITNHVHAVFMARGAQSGVDSLVLLAEKSLWKSGQFATNGFDLCLCG